MIIPKNVCESIWKHAKPYLDVPIPDGYTLGSILNAIAWENAIEDYVDSNGTVKQREAWGLSRKSGGKNVDSPVGLIAEDILHYKPQNLLFDIFAGADIGLILRPNCGGDIGPPKGADRVWVAPVKPEGHIPPVIVDPEVPPIVVIPEEPVADYTARFAELLTAIDRVGARVDALGTKVDEFKQRVEDLAVGDREALKHETNRAIADTTENVTNWLRNNRVKVKF